jgi:arabinogalactan endo-1,4-beta-galactosidase
MRLCLFLSVLVFVSSGACYKNNSGENNLSDTVVFAKGADVSWLTEMEASGIHFYNNSGEQQDCMQLLKDKGMNTIRLRVWVNPTAGWCNKQDVINKAVRAKNLGMQVMIDFHYSDWWADPGNQNKPTRWLGITFSALKDSLYAHTYDVLMALKSNGVKPHWVQVGNETNDGMLWEDGRASANMANFAQLINKGYQAVKAVDTSIKVIVHLSNGFDNHLYRWLFDGLKHNGASWDIIGMSLYPSVSSWQTTNDQCFANISDMIVRYNKPVMICEVGMPANYPTVCKAFLTDLIQRARGINNKMCQGVLYWEPQCYNNWQGYGLGAFDASGKPTLALDAFTL